MTRFSVRGTFRPGGEERSFTREIDAENDGVARERVFSQLGSEHGLSRTQIAVDEVEEVDG